MVDIAEIEIKPVRQSRRDQWSMIGRLEYQLHYHHEQYYQLYSGAGVAGAQLSYVISSGFISLLAFFSTFTLAQL